jgi:hypothetical protein
MTVFNTYVRPLLPVEHTKVPSEITDHAILQEPFNGMASLSPQTHLLLGIRIRLRILKLRVLLNFHTVVFAFEN